MKTNIDQPTTSPGFRRTLGTSATGFPQAPTVNPPERHFSWLSSYDEEWALFVHEKSMHRTRSGFDPADPDPRPRVWNCPLG